MEESPIEYGDLIAQLGQQEERRLYIESLRARLKQFLHDRGVLFSEDTSAVPEWAINETSIAMHAEARVAELEETEGELADDRYAQVYEEVFGEIFSSEVLDDQNPALNELDLLVLSRKLADCKPTNEETGNASYENSEKKRIMAELFAKQKPSVWLEVVDEMLAGEPLTIADQGLIYTEVVRHNLKLNYAERVSATVERLFATKPEPLSPKQLSTLHGLVKLRLTEYIGRDITTWQGDATEYVVKNYGEMSGRWNRVIWHLMNVQTLD